MFTFETPWLALQGFFDAGGDVLWAIFAATLLMWTLIIERLWFLRFVKGEIVANARHEWQRREETSSWYALRIRRQLVSAVSLSINRNVKIIHALMVLLPLLGLLGTVTGMIQIFNVMAVAGTTNPRLMAAGVSAATIPTMAGLVAALSGYWFTVWFGRRSRAEATQLEDLLSIDELRGATQ